MKYVIELEEAPFTNDFGETLYRAKGFNSRLIFDQNGIDKLEPYEEHNGEEVWEIARKILTPKQHGGYSIDEIREMFSDIVSPEEVFDLPLSEVLSKIREYKKKKELHVGDEVEVDNLMCIRRGIVRNADYKNNYAWVFGDDFGGYYKIESLTKTGKSYPEVAKAIKELGRRQ